MQSRAVLRDLGRKEPGTTGETEAKLGWGAARLSKAGCWRLSDSRAGAHPLILLSLGAQLDQTAEQEHVLSSC